MVVFRRYARNCTHPPVKVIINNYKLILQTGEPQLHVSLYLGTEYWQIQTHTMKILFKMNEASVFRNRFPC
jgi:hypothetical protein